MPTMTVQRPALNAEHRFTIAALVTALSAARTGKPADLQGARDACRASRERWGDDLHDYLRGCAIAVMANRSR